ncbi:MAG: transposase [Deltaproteobacteria bacterium]|nr:transposase [Deltaproteobacteria bacterium]
MPAAHHPTLLAYVGRFSIDELATVEAIAMDMWPPARKSSARLSAAPTTRSSTSASTVLGHMNVAVHQVRRRENKQLRADGDDRLVSSKHLWLYGDRKPRSARYSRCGG